MQYLQYDTTVICTFEPSMLLTSYTYGKVRKIKNNNPKKKEKRVTQKTAKKYISGPVDHFIEALKK